MLENHSLWDVATQCHQALSENKIPYAVIGEVAVCLHGYQRNTVDLDLLIRADDQPLVRETLEAISFTWDSVRAEFSTPANVAVQFLLAGQRAGKNSTVRLPDPAASDVWREIEGLPVLTLAKLIESKIACGEGNLRRTHKDFADVVELIATNKLDGSFARNLDKSIRPAYRELVRHATGG